MLSCPPRRRASCRWGSITDAPARWRSLPAPPPGDQCGLRGTIGVCFVVSVPRTPRDNGLYAVARAAGVSPMAVSRVFRSSPHVSADKPLPDRPLKIRFPFSQLVLHCFRRHRQKLGGRLHVDREPPDSTLVVVKSAPHRKSPWRFWIVDVPLERPSTLFANDLRRANAMKTRRINAGTRLARHPGGGAANEAGQTNEEGVDTEASGEGRDNPSQRSARHR